MKKLTTLLLAVLMVFTLVACGSEEDNAKLVEYVEENGRTLEDSMEESFSGSGLTCNAKVDVEGNGFVFTIKIDGIDGLTSEQKDLMQETYDGMGSVFDASLSMMQSELPELEELTIKVCEEDGDLIATIHAD